MILIPDGLIITNPGTMGSVRACCATWVGNSFGSLQAHIASNFCCFVLTLCFDKNWILKIVRLINAVFGKGILWVLVVVVW